MMRRNGSTLVEIVICMSISTSLMLTAVGLVHQTLTVSSRTSERADLARSLARLSTQFRADAHRATEAKTDSETEMRLTQPDGSEVIYRFADHRIARQHQSASGQLEHDSFSCEAGHVAKFNVLSQPERAALLVQRDRGLANMPPQTELHVEAVLSRLPWAEQGGEEAQ
jgi:type II secretory pathway component PulJ